MNGATLAWAPLLPPTVLLALAIVSALVLAVALLRRPLGRPPAGFMLRGAGVLALLAALGNPSVVIEDRKVLPDILVVVVDETASQNIGDRRSRSEAALAELTAELDGRDDIETRVVRVGPGDADAGAGRTPAAGTRLFTALERALGDIPRNRLAGSVFITDGQIHDAPEDPASLALGAPLHTLLSGKRNEGDRRLTIVESPGYGIVGQSIGLTIRIDEPADVQARQAQLTIRRDGETLLVIAPVTGGAWGDWADFSVTVDIDVAPGPIEVVGYDEGGCGNDPDCPPIIETVLALNLS